MGTVDGEPVSTLGVTGTTPRRRGERGTPDTCAGWRNSEGEGTCIVTTDHITGLCGFCRGTVFRRPDLAARLPVWRRQIVYRALGLPDPSDVAVAAGNREDAR